MPAGADPIAQNQGSRVGTGAVLHGEPGDKRRVVRIFPASFSGDGIERDDDFVGILAIHGVERVAVDCDSRISFAEGTRPQLRRPDAGHECGEAFGIGGEIPVRSRELRPFRKVGREG